jgi:hypothetical protein
MRRLWRRVRTVPAMVAASRPVGLCLLAANQNKDACFRNSETIVATGVMKVVLKDAAAAARPSPGTLFVPRSLDVSL